MRVSPFVYAAEVEQAAAATAVLDQVTAATVAPGRATAWSDAAMDEVAERYGLDGCELPFDYQNDRGVGDGRAPLFVVLH